MFVHGLAATPVAFLQAINEFQNDPALLASYQFWVFLYPTGRTIVLSALRLRTALGRAEAAYGSDPAFHRMVIVGHSLGGILAHMVVSDSGREVWDAALSVSPEELRASPATRVALDQLLFFHPLPVRAPGRFHRHPPQGQPAGEQCDRPLLQRPGPAAARPGRGSIAELEALNGPGVIKDENFRDASMNGIGELRVDSPLLLAVGRLPVRAGVPYHTIAFRFAGHARNDLVVPLWRPAWTGPRQRPSSRAFTARNRARRPGGDAPHPAGTPGRALNIPAAARSGRGTLRGRRSVS